MNWEDFLSATGSFGGGLVGLVAGQKELLIGLGGALIGGFFTSRATKKAHILQVEDKERQDGRLLRNTLLLIQAEIECGWAIYKEEFVPDLLKTPRHEPYLTLLPIGKNPFPIYDSAPSALAEAPPEITAKIVHIYMRAKGLIETIGMNNEAYRIASAHARDAVRAAAKRDSLRDMNYEELYQRERYEMAVYLHMIEIGQALKDLTCELEADLGILSRAINEFVNSPSDR